MPLINAILLDFTHDSVHGDQNDVIDHSDDDVAMMKWRLPS